MLILSANIVYSNGNCNELTKVAGEFLMQYFCEKCGELSTAESFKHRELLSKQTKEKGIIIIEHNLLPSNAIRSEREQM